MNNAALNLGDLCDMSFIKSVYRLLDGSVYNSKGFQNSRRCSLKTSISSDADSANIFMNDVATRLKNRVQLTTDGLKAYLEARNPAYCKCAVIGSHTFRPKVCLVKFSSHFF